MCCLSDRTGGFRTLGKCNGRMCWPTRGVYFFFENGEQRTTSGSGLRVVRVGTHALTKGGQTTLWNRLATHKGAERGGGGNHRGSVFRLLAGSALSRRDPSLHCETWAKGQSAPREIRVREVALECAVSHYIRSMPFLWLEVDDECGPESMRKSIERNSIALLSNRGKSHEEIIDPPSAGWLGRYSHLAQISESGLWNSRHTDEVFDPGFLSNLRDRIRS
jgi:hypothetical protein